MSKRTIEVVKAEAIEVYMTYNKAWAKDSGSAEASDEYLIMRLLNIIGVSHLEIAEIHYDMAIK